MLYSLIQNFPEKEISLHVSTENVAVILFQKFGFRQEEYIIDFYRKYIPAEQYIHSSFKNAFCMRLIKKNDNKI